MRIFTLFTLGICVSTALAQPKEAPATIAQQELAQLEPAPLEPEQAPRPTDPKAQIELDLRGFLGALNNLSSDRADANYQLGSHILDARLGFFGQSEWVSYFVAMRGKSRYRFGNIEVEKLDDTTARVKLNYDLLSPNLIYEADRPAVEKTLTEARSEVLDLKRETVRWTRQEKWRIVASPYADLRRGDPRLSLQRVVYFASQHAGTLNQLRAEIALTRLKQNALGTLQFVQDYDTVFRFSNDFWPTAIRPYVQNEASFLIPGTSAPFTFNDNLSDKDLGALAEPAQTVLFYEGRDEEPEFRYDDRAAICFADGHAQLVTRKQSESLRWRP